MHFMFPWCSCIFRLFLVNFLDFISSRNNYTENNPPHPYYFINAPVYRSKYEELFCSAEQRFSSTSSLKACVKIKHAKWMAM